MSLLVAERQELPVGTQGRRAAAFAGGKHRERLERSNLPDHQVPRLANGREPLRTKERSPADIPVTAVGTGGVLVRSPPIALDDTRLPQTPELEGIMAAWPERVCSHQDLHAIVAPRDRLA